MLRRNPIKSDSLLVMGVDAGLASTGVVILEKKQRNVQLIYSELIKTKKATKKLRGNLRAATDDQNRYREIWLALNRILDRFEFKIKAIGIETYSVYGARAGNAWKTAIVFGGIVFLAFCEGIYVAPFTPLDLKRCFCKCSGASKQDVEKALSPYVNGFSSEILRYVKTNREHIADATGHAYLVLKELEENRVLFGL